MSGWSFEEITARPLMLPVNPVRTFYSGGSLWRAFRGESPAQDSRWAEDWLASCIPARQPAPDGSSQGLSVVETIDGQLVTLRDVVEECPDEMLGRGETELGENRPGVQAKLVSPSSRVPVHTHPDDIFALRHFAAPCGKAEAWIVLEAPGTQSGPAYAGVGFREHATEADFARAVAAQDHNDLIAMVHRTPIQAGDVVFIKPGEPHFISGGTLFLEIQQPADLGVLAEWDGFVDGPSEAGGGLDMAAMLSCFKLEPQTRKRALDTAFQPTQLLQRTSGSREYSLFSPDVDKFFQARRTEIHGDFTPDDGSYYVALVVSGAGVVRGPGWQRAIRGGDAFVCPASLVHSLQSPEDSLVIIRAFGPRI